MTEFEWTRLFGTGWLDIGNDLATGADGSIYVAGETTVSHDDEQTNNFDTYSIKRDAFLSKFNPDGTKEWTRLFGTSKDDTGYALSTSADGSIYIAGSTRGDLDGQTFNGGNSDAFISKLNDLDEFIATIS